jgi:hypothetical protein
LDEGNCGTFGKEKNLMSSMTLDQFALEPKKQKNKKNTLKNFVKKNHGVDVSMIIVK